MFLENLRNIVRKKILFFFEPITYINFFSKEDKFKFFTKKLRNITITELLNDATDDNKIIIKMDIQGYEPKILLQLSDLINKYNITHCFFEVNQKDENVMLEAIKKFGKDYSLKDLNDNFIDLENIGQYMKQVVLLEKKI